MLCSVRRIHYHLTASKTHVLHVQPSVHLFHIRHALRPEILKLQLAPTLPSRLLLCEVCLIAQHALEGSLQATWWEAQRPPIYVSIRQLRCTAAWPRFDPADSLELGTSFGQIHSQEGGVQNMGNEPVPEVNVYNNQQGSCWSRQFDTLRYNSKL